MFNIGFCPVFHLLRITFKQSAYQGGHIQVRQPTGEPVRAAHDPASFGVLRNLIPVSEIRDEFYRKDNTDSRIPQGL